MGLIDGIANVVGAVKDVVEVAKPIVQTVGEVAGTVSDVGSALKGVTGAFKNNDKVQSATNVVNDTGGGSSTNTNKSNNTDNLVGLALNPSPYGSGTGNMTFLTNPLNSTYQPFDMNGDGALNESDLAYIAEHMGQTIEKKYTEDDINKLIEEYKDGGEFSTSSLQKMLEENEELLTDNSDTKCDLTGNGVVDEKDLRYLMGIMQAYQSGFMA